jgi:hypothetical protein
MPRSCLLCDKFSPFYGADNPSIHIKNSWLRWLLQHNIKTIEEKLEDISLNIGDTVNKRGKINNMSLRESSSQ